MDGEQEARQGGEGEKGESGTGGGSVPDSSVPGSSVPGGSAPTEAERQANLERRLEESLGEFDETLMREQELLAERREAATEATAARRSGGSGGSSGTGSTFAGGAEDGGGATGGKPSTGEKISEEEARAAGRIPPDIPDASGDDIVARQLREAAMAEEDPELREKLWDEYRRYKAGQRKQEDRDQGEKTEG